MRLSDENIRGRTVIAADGVVLGEIVALLLDTEAWKVASLQVKLRKDAAERIGAEHHVFRPTVIEVASQHVQSVGDAVLLNVPTDQLRPAPHEEHREEPAPVPAT